MKNLITKIHLGIVVVLICSIIILIGCKGNTGPIGPAGPSGNADVSVYNFAFNASDLILDSVDSTYYYISFSDSSIGNKINNGAATLVYLYSDSIWNPLPYTEPHDPTLTIAYYFESISLVIEVITNHGDARQEMIDFLNGELFRLRLFIIPANESYFLKSMSKKPSYNEIKTYLNL